MVVVVDVVAEVEVLVEGISFANGLEMDKEEQFLLYCETGRARVHKYHLQGERAGQAEVLVDNLPGMPDNIRLNDNGNYYIGLNPRIPGGGTCAVTWSPLLTWRLLTDLWWRWMPRAPLSP